jgi:glycosyltransferase involved in cell wall biosynthesis
MKVVFCWWTFEGYFAACFKQLARQTGIELVIFALKPDPQSLAPYDTDLLAGLTVRLLSLEQMTDRRFLLEALRSERADVVVVPGIVNPAALWAIARPELRHAAVVMAWDTPWRGTWRQILGRRALSWRLRRIDHVVVAGERAWQCVRRIGFPEAAISRGMYGIDFDDLSRGAAPQAESALPAPRAFGYVGRYVPGKGIDELADAYARYRRDVSDPWALETCGRGPLKHRLDDAGARDHGFLQPPRLKEFFARIGVFVLPSRSDPWPLALVEACAAGLAVIATEACGSAVELVRPFYNGLTVASNDAAALTRALRWVHDHPHRLVQMGARSRELAQAYSAAAWARRWSAVIEGVARG